MVSSAVISFVCLGGLAWFILSLVFAFRGLNKDLLAEVSTNEMIFRKPMIGRVGCAMMGIFVSVGSLLEFSQGIIEAIQRHHPVPLWAYFSLYFGVAVASAFGGLLLYLCGPNEFCLDLNRRTYRFRSGWPQSPTVQSGDWEDIAGVYVRRISGSRSGVHYSVGIAWRKKRWAWPTLGLFGREDAANALADKMAALLGVPQIVPPPLGKAFVTPGEVTLLTKPAANPPYRPYRPTLFPASVFSETETDNRLPNTALNAFSAFLAREGGNLHF